MRRTGGFAYIVLAVALALGPAAGSARAATKAASDVTTDVIRLANATRAQDGLPALHRSRALDRSALMKVDEIRSCGSFSHTPCGTSFARTFQQTGYLHGRVRVGENIYWGSGRLGTPAGAISAWLHSPPHRANLLGRGWRDMGVGVERVPSIFGASDVSIVVLQFGRR